MPQLISERPNVASSAATARSHAIKGVNAPPKHQPLTIAIVGFDIVHEQAPLPRVGRSGGAGRHVRAAARRVRESTPSGPSRRRRNRRRRSARRRRMNRRSRARLSTSTMSSFKAGFIALRLSGRFSVDPCDPLVELDAHRFPGSDVHSAPPSLSTLSVRRTETTVTRRPPSKDDRLQKTIVRLPWTITRSSRCQRDRPGEDDALDVAPDPRELVGACARCVTRGDVLLDDRALVELLGRVVRGRADQLHAALVRAAVRVGARRTPAGTSGGC